MSTSLALLRIKTFSPAAAPFSLHKAGIEVPHLGFVIHRRVSEQVESAFSAERLQFLHSVQWEMATPGIQYDVNVTED